MKLKFLGATETVTGSKYLLRNQGKNFLIDCGLFQGKKQLRLQNWEPFPFPPEKIDAVILTHAHIDHTGYLPLLVKQGFKGPIYATEATCDLSEILLRDSARIHEEDARRANKYGYTKHKPALPLYTEEDAIRSLRHFKKFNLGDEYHLSEDLSFHGSRAGHILGSAILTFKERDGTTLVFSGDLGRPYHPIIKPPATIQYADELILESTYGDRLHETENVEEKLAAIINKTSKKGGTIIIPSFAVGRTQTILYYVNQLKKNNLIPNIPIYLDSPMAQEATDILEKHPSETHISKEFCHEICSAAQYVGTPEESKSLYGIHMPKIIISASGMVEGGRVLHHIAHYGPDHHNTIIFVGFQAPMTRGDRILSGANEVKIFGTMVPIRASVEILESLSSHADYNEILEWLRAFNKPPRRVFLTHGEKSAAEALKERIEEEFDWRVIIPKYAEEFDL